jgi:hypothetical protein
MEGCAAADPAPPARGGADPAVNMEQADPAAVERLASREADKLAAKSAVKRKQPQMRYQGVEILLAKFERES